MSKKIVRLTESDLKNYIKRVVAEQVGGAPAAKPAAPVANPYQGIVGKNAQMYLDAGKTKKAGLYKIVKFTSRSTDNKTVDFDVQDLDTINANNGDVYSSNDKAIKSMQWTCGTTYFNCFFKERFNGTRLYCPSLVEALSTAMNCDQFKVNTKPDFASNGGNKPTDFA